MLMVAEEKETNTKEERLEMHCSGFLLLVCLLSSILATPVRVYAHLADGGVDIMESCDILRFSKPISLATLHGIECDTRKCHLHDSFPADLPVLGSKLAKKIRRIFHDC